MLKFIKFGFGFCMDHVCYDLRDGLINRKTAIELVLKYDGRCNEQYVKDFCNYIEITTAKFYETCEKFRGNMWTQNDGEYKNKIHEILESEYATK
jgi:hypothetical protein